MGKSVFVETLENLSGKDFLHISGLDLGFYVFVYTSLYLWTYLLQVKAAPLAAIDINSVALQKQSELAQTLSTMKGFLIFLAVLIIIFHPRRNYRYKLFQRNDICQNAQKEI